MAPLEASLARILAMLASVRSLRTLADPIGTGTVLLGAGARSRSCWACASSHAKGITALTLGWLP